MEGQDGLLKVILRLPCVVDGISTPQQHACAHKHTHTLNQSKNKLKEIKHFCFGLFSFNIILYQLFGNFTQCTLITVDSHSSQVHPSCCVPLPPKTHQRLRINFDLCSWKTGQYLESLYLLLLNRLFSLSIPHPAATLGVLFLEEIIQILP